MVKRVVGDVAVRVGGDVGPLGIAMTRGAGHMRRFEKRGQLMSARMAMVGKRVGIAMAAMAGVMVLAARRSISAVDNIGKTADKLGITTDALQELRAVAESAGIAQGSLDSSLERLSKRLGEAALGTGAANVMLKEMGLEVNNLVGMGLDRALQVIADKMALIKDPTERAAKAAALFGREGVAMVNLMREGSGGMERMRAEARKLGVVIDEDLVRSAEDAQTKLDLMSRVIKAQLRGALISLAPLLVSAATGIAGISRAISDLLKLDYKPPELQTWAEFRETIAGYKGAVNELFALNRTQSAYNANVERFGKDSKQAAKWNDELTAARERLTVAVEAQRKKEVGLAIVKTTLLNLGSETKSARERARLAGLTAEEAEKELMATERARIATEAFAKAQAVLNGTRAAGNDMTDAQLETVLKLVDAWEAAQIAASSILNPKKDTVEPKSPGTGSLVPTQADAESLIANFATQRELIDTFYADQLEKLVSFREAGVDIGKNYDDLELEIKRQHAAAIENLEAQKRAVIIGNMRTMFSGLTSLMNTKSRTLFKIGKAAAIANAIVNTHAGITRALKEHPAPWSFAVAAGIAAKGFASVSAIKSTSFSGGGGGAAGGGGGARGGGGSSPTPAPEAVPVTQQVSVNLQGAEMFGRATVLQLIEAMQDAFADGAEFTVTG